MPVQTQTGTETTFNGPIHQPQINIDFVNAQMINYSWNALSNDLPKDYSNAVALYQSGSTIPWGKTPIAPVQTPDSNATSGSGSFEGLTIGPGKPYMLLYAVGNDAGDGGFDLRNVVASAWVSSTQADHAQFTQPSISIPFIPATGDSIVVAWTMPAGQDPAGQPPPPLPQGSHYFGIWGPSSSNAVQPSWTQEAPTKLPITSNQSASTESFRFNMGSGQWYAIAYVAGTQPTDIACWTTFQAPA